VTVDASTWLLINHSPAVILSSSHFLRHHVFESVSGSRTRIRIAGMANHTNNNNSSSSREQRRGNGAECTSKDEPWVSESQTIEWRSAPCRSAHFKCS
jgi:hypothetical protein